MKSNAIYFSLLIILSSVCACKKETKDATELLTNNSYKNWNRYKMKTGTNPAIQYDICNVDDIWSFHSDLQLILDLNHTICPGISDTTNIFHLSWSMNSTHDSLKLVLNNLSSYPSNYKIQKLNAQEMELLRSIELVDINGTSMGYRDDVEFFKAVE